MSLPLGLRALESRDYRIYYAGNIVSQIGTWMQTISQSWLVLQLTGSPFLLGLTATLQFGPILLFSVFAGVLADRLTRRNILMFTQSVQGTLALLLGLLVWGGHVRYWQIAIMAVLWGMTSALDQPTRQSFIMELVGREHLASAVGMNSASFNGARIVGPAVAGLLIARFGVAVAFLLNALSFVAVLGALVAIRTEGQPAPGGRLGIREGLRGALSYAAATPPVAFTLGLLVIVSLLVLNFNVVVPLVAHDVLHEGAHGFGLLMSSLGAGAVTGAIGLAFFGRERPSLSFLAATAAVLSAGIMALASIGHFVPAAALLAVLGCVQILFSTGCNTTLQLAAPDALRGRVMGLYALTFAGMTPFGSLFMGTMAEHFGVRVACAVGGAGGLLAVSVLVLVARRNLVARPGVI